MWGQYVLSPEDFRSNLFQAAYNTLTLFALEGEWTATRDLPWQLEITRFVAPLASVTGVLVILTQGAWIRFINSFVRFRKDHVIVAGLGRRSWQFVQSCHQQYQLVICELDPKNPLIERARRLGMAVFVGDVLDPVIFEKMNLAGAKHLVAFTGNDGVNVELTIKARAYLREHGTHQLLIHMHVDNTHVSERLMDYPKFFSDKAAAQVNFFSVYALNARILFRNYPPEVFAHFFGQRQVHIALYHFGRQAEHILLEASRICHFSNEQKVKFTILDDDAEEKGRQFLVNYPHLGTQCEIRFLSVPLLESNTLSSVDPTSMSEVTEHVICFPTDGDNLEFALLLRAYLLKRSAANAPIVVRMQQSSGLAQLLESNYGGPEIPDGLYPFGMLDEVLHFENILADGLDLVARMFHETYLEDREGMQVDKRLYSTLYDWAALTESERASNRHSADHLEAKLRAVGCALDTNFDPDFAFTDSEALLLARMEHNRWCGEKIAAGWRYGPARIESAKVNPVIGSWDDLPDHERERQVNQVKRLPALVATKLGKGFVRLCHVGITGHRLHKLNMSDPVLHQEVESVLGDIVSRYPGRQFVIVSPLAEGADRLVARIAMEKFGMSLLVPLPLPFELYKTDFSTEASVEEFKILVGKAEAYFELPMRFGSQEELATPLDGSSNDRRNKQYALAGAWCVQHTDELIAIWDEQPEQGVGGTAQIVRWRDDGSVDEEFNSVSAFFQNPRMNPTRVVRHVYER